MRTIAAIAVLALLNAQTSQAEDFDRTLLKGRWVELFGIEKPDCSNALIFEHALSADGKSLTTTFTRNWLFSELQGKRVEVETVQVVNMTRDTLVFRKSSEAEPGIPNEWEMIFSSPNLYKLRADGWELGEGRDFVMRQRCP
jgi:hypothetical protein